MEVVGESHYQRALERICGGHSREGHQLRVDAELVREPDNPYDSNAIAVTIDGDTIGYLPRKQADRVSRQMVDDSIHKALCDAEVVGGWRTNQHDEGSFGVRLSMPCRGWIDFGLGKQPPAGTDKRLGSQGKDNSSRPTAAESGPLKGQYIVLWGAKDDGDEASELAAQGAHIMAGIGKSTTMVVQVDDELTSGMRNSATYKKAQARIADGAELEVITLKALRAKLL